MRSSLLSLPTLSLIGVACLAHACWALPQGGTSCDALPLRVQVPSCLAQQSGPPVLRNVAGFSHMENLTKENYPEGGFLYNDITQDKMTTVSNLCQKGSCDTSNIEAVRPLVIACAQKLSDSLKRAEIHDLQIVPNREYSQNLRTEAYKVVWYTGRNEDTVKWKTVFFCDSGYTYMYGFSCGADWFEEMASVFYDIFDRLRLEPGY